MKRTRSQTRIEEKDDEMYKELKISRKNGKTNKDDKVDVKVEVKVKPVKTIKSIKTVNPEKSGKEKSRGKSQDTKASKSTKATKATKSKRAKSVDNKKSKLSVKKEKKDKKANAKKKKNENINSENNIEISDSGSNEVSLVDTLDSPTTFKGNIPDSLGPKCVRLGLCCINNLLRNRKDPIFCSRSIVLATYKSKGKAEAIAKATQNVKDIEKLIRWNKAHYIDCLRLSSDMFPHYSNHSRIEEINRYTLEFARKDLERIGKLARDMGQRLTFHPGQFNVVGSPNEAAFQQTIVDLKMHADILDLMQMDDNSIMVVHGGGVYGDKPKTLQRWIDNWKRLPDNVRRRLVLENDEKNFSVIDCLEVNKAIDIPIVFDNHHFMCYKQTHPDVKFEDIRVYIKQVLDTWTKKGLRPKFHLSEQDEEKQVGAHSAYIKTFPDYYLEIPEKYGVGVDVMVEAKAKEAAILDLYKRYKKQLLSSYSEQLEEEIDEIFDFDKKNMQAVWCDKCPDFAN